MRINDYPTLSWTKARSRSVSRFQVCVSQVSLEMQELYLLQVSLTGLSESSQAKLIGRWSKYYENHLKDF